MQEPESIEAQKRLKQLRSNKDMPLQPRLQFSPELQKNLAKSMVENHFADARAMVPLGSGVDEESELTKNAWYKRRSFNPYAPE